MLKFLSITLLFFILFVNSVFADSLSTEIIDLEKTVQNRSSKIQEIQRLQKQQQEIIVSMQKEIDELKKSKDNNSKIQEEKLINLTIKLQQIDELQKKMNNEFQQRIDELNNDISRLVRILKEIINEIYL